jgi:hypothetical protein
MSMLTGVKKRFSVLARLHRDEEFASASDVDEFEAKLGALVKRGVVTVVPTLKHLSSIDEEAWFRDTRTGLVYRYIKPDWPSRGFWGLVEEPGEPSYFESLCADLYPTRAQYDELVKKLDVAWAAGQIECALPLEKDEVEDAFFHHPPTDETYDLTLVNPWQKGGCWMKVYFSRKSGTWPGTSNVIGPPPWRRPPGDDR